MSLAGFEESTLQLGVYEEIKRVIMRGEMAPSATISIRSLAEALGTSMMPVREAIGRLLAQNVLEASGKRAFRLWTPTFDGFQDLLEARLDLEGRLAELAAQNTSDGDLARL